jgi:hypothetical protein
LDPPPIGRTGSAGDHSRRAAAVRGARARARAARSGQRFGGASAGRRIRSPASSVTATLSIVALAASAVIALLALVLLARGG